MTRRVVLVTAGHLASTPRIVKAADALQGAGYEVRVVSGEHVKWCVDASEGLAKTRTWRWRPVYWRPATDRWLYQMSRVRHRVVQRLTAAVGPGRLPLGILARAISRIAPELARAAAEEPADLVYAGTSGGLAVGAVAAARLQVPYSLDLEDFHSDELSPGRHTRAAHNIIESVERRVLQKAVFRTAGSEPIASAYAEKYGVPVLPINNVFPFAVGPPPISPGVPGRLRMVWLSQTVGPGRGIEEAIRATGVAGVSGELHVRGYPVPGYVESLRQLVAETSPALAVVHHMPDPNRTPEELCTGYDIGLALEQPDIRNRDLCLCNKPFTYMLAGLAVVATRTRGQLALADLGSGVLLYSPGDIRGLAAGLRSWADNPGALVQARRASWEAARRRWHWEHPLERGALLAAVAAAIGGP